MWILTALLTGGETHYLLSSKTYVVGRKNCDIILTGDQSISRAHAHLAATDQTLTLKDTSKYGTFVNSQRLTENTEWILKSGDNVTFGVFHSKFSVQHHTPVVCSSCLDTGGKATLSQALSGLGGKLVSNWNQDCTHLAMPTAKVTIKTICALLCCRPIVKPEFFTELLKAAQKKSPAPTAESFIPDIDEPSLNKEDVNLGSIPARSKLFTGKTFVFLSAKQLKRLSAAVSFGGGRSQLLEEGSVPQDLLESPHSCVVDATIGSTQHLLSSSSSEWANSVTNIVQRKGLRIITESEIGLAAIYASCDKHCNPSSGIPDSESIRTVAPGIQGASLSQSGAVDETVLLAASQNITVYAVNTEPSQRTELSDVTGLVVVGETQTSHLHRSKPVSKKTTTECTGANTMRSSVNTVENTDSHIKKLDSKLTGSGASSSRIRSQSNFPKSNGGTKSFLQKQSPQKQRSSPQASPQKQSTLTNFFSPVNKKRPLEDEPFAVMPEPKRPVLESSISLQAPNTQASSKETYSHSSIFPAAASHAPLGLGEDLFVGQPGAQTNRVSNTMKEEPQSRKRKEMEAEIQMDELESLMSEDFDEQPSTIQSPKAQPMKHSSTKQDTEESSSLSKRQRVENLTNEKPQEKNVGAQKKDSNVSDCIVSIKSEPIEPSGNRTTPRDCGKPQASSMSKTIWPFEDEDASFIGDLELLRVDIFQPTKETKSPVKPAAIKQEVQESNIDEDLPKKLVLVEIRSLTVSAPSKTNPQKTQHNGHTRNFKCFRKAQMQCAGSFPHIIGGSDLLVHNRGKNSDMDEWLKDAAEEDRQSKRNESMGDDLFRYNPTKLIKRR